MTRSSGGFTLVELVLVIVLIGVLSVTVAPRFFSRSGYDQVAVRRVRALDGGDDFVLGFRHRAVPTVAVG